MDYKTMGTITIYIILHKLNIFYFFYLPVQFGQRFPGGKVEGESQFAVVVVPFVGIDSTS